jgi:uncharacterized protein (DUF2267 family)
MSMTGLDAFDRTVHRTNKAYVAMKATLHKRELLAHIAHEFAGYDSEAVARALFKVMLRHVSEGELEELWG